MEDRPQQQNIPEEAISIPPDAIHCVSGLIYQVLRPGTGKERPGPDDVVQVRYEAWTETGQRLETSGDDGTPQIFVLSNANPGLSEALQIMAMGQKMRVWIPPNLTSNEQRKGKERTLIFDIELVSFIRMKEPPSLPPELTSPRKD
ncbi:MAG TPA: FKBP-type peptidyl-prolyl cis-trans isomerase [Chloroflexia bacterium]|nr:FKBP-type peptidyl-prolyl cis-trans isomerase [Chloroflexia bacterium]